MRFTHQLTPSIHDLKNPPSDRLKEAIKCDVWMRRAGLKEKWEWGVVLKWTYWVCGCGVCLVRAQPLDATPESSLYTL